MFMCMLWVCVPVVVVERSGAYASLGRSRELTKGNRWPIFFIFLFLMLIGFVSGIVFGLFRPEVAAQLIFQEVLNILTMSIQAVLVAVTYHELREVKEGVSIEDLTRVFE